MQLNNDLACKELSTLQHGLSLRVLEFFSGIGGLHYALDRVDPTAIVLASFDMNSFANSCYEHNFGIKPCNTSIDTLGLKAIEKFKSNCWLLSPPCQPFTQGGKRLDHLDGRSLGLLRIIKLLDTTSIPPDYVFLENVPNFETSECRLQLVQTLDRRNYHIEEYLVSPLQIGVANDRKRYYLTAKLCKESNHDTHRTPYLDSPNMMTSLDVGDKGPPIPPLISSYLETLEDISPYLVPEPYILKRKTFRFDLVKPTDTRSACFTKGYGSHHIIGSGSFLQTENLQMSFAADDNQAVLESRPRFFTPREVARLHGFPIDGGCERLHGCRYSLVFPASVPQSQQYKLLGNSLSVDMVAHLLRLMLK